MNNKLYHHHICLKSPLMVGAVLFVAVAFSPPSFFNMHGQSQLWLSSCFKGNTLCVGNLHSTPHHSTVSKTTKYPVSNLKEPEAFQAYDPLDVASYAMSKMTPKDGFISSEFSTSSVKAISHGDPLLKVLKEI